MQLFLSAQDINELTIGLIDGHSLIKEKIKSSDPDNFEQEIINTLAEWRIIPDQLTAVLVVRGPGSPTALRVVVTIANTIGFVHQIPVIGVINSERISARELIIDVQSVGEQKFKPICPFYNRPPV